jgi:cell division protease FtsH
MPTPEEPARRKVIASVAYVALFIATLWILQSAVRQTPQKQFSYSEFWTAVNAGRVESAHLDDDRIDATLRPENGKKDKEHVVINRLPRIDDTALVNTLRDKGVQLSGETSSSPWWQFAVWLVPLFIFWGFWIYAARRMAKASGPLSVGKSKAKIYDKSEKEPVTFADVAGVDEAKAELVEIVSFLRAPARYRAIGAKPPRGVLLVGPPGTGKTLLARAVAGEAGVPFFSLSGSEFVEMFVGVGAARVRDMFQEAKKREPCIIFIDELDAVGKTRALGGAAFGGHEEREQTLNQLLAEMDGFDPGAGVVILAATNRPEVLDRALLRAGRFDRQILVDRPDVRGRTAILAVHVRKLALAPDVTLEVLARRTPGMSGAELATVCNEAALAAVRRSSQTVAQRDFEVAIDRIQLGLEKQGRTLGENERRRVAFHEAGHTLIALSVEHADPVHRVTIIPRSIGALGATLQLPTEERHLMTKSELLDRVCVAMGGRCAEDLAFGEISTGSENDLEQATEIARQMVRRFGMSQRVGPVTYGAIVAPYLDRRLSLSDERTYSERTALEIDAEVRTIVENAENRARGILAERRGALEKLAERLLQDETLDRPDIDALLKTIEPERRARSRPTPVHAPH